MKLSSKNVLIWALGVLILVTFTNCATYHAKTAEVETNLFDGDFDRAIVNIDQNKFLLKDRNKLLYLMEKGKVAHMMGNYEASNELFEKAYMLIDDKIKTNAAEAIASKLTNPMAEPYKGEDFEKVAIHYYKALNYQALGNADEALVEAKRINIKLLEMNSKYEGNKNKYSEDAFSEILQGILYESTGDINNAFIAYRNAADLYKANGDAYFSVPIPLQLKYDLLRTAKSLGFNEDYQNYQTEFNLTLPKNKTPDAEAIVFWEDGLGPVKDQIKITASGAEGAFVGTYDDDNNNIIIPIPAGVNLGINAIAIPKYVRRDPYYKHASLIVNDTEQPFELSQDYYAIAKQCLRDRMMREAIDIALRFGAKKGVSKGLSMLAGHFLGSAGETITKWGTDAAGAALEKADTRNWQSLPATISYLRVPLKKGENKFIIKKYGADGIDTDTIQITYKKGLQVINYFDLSRNMHFASNDNRWKNSLPMTTTTEDLSTVQKEEGPKAKKHSLFKRKKESSES